MKTHADHGGERVPAHDTGRRWRDLAAVGLMILGGSIVATTLFEISTEAGAIFCGLGLAVVGAVMAFAD
ncbi:hypothetical protein GCM10022221_67550 [Actinocorallia aurea]